jgi:diketogulonate reductase-like aldo/keto reductase
VIGISIDGDCVPALGLGTFRLVGDDCAVMVREALAAGYRHIDTARAYDNEEAVGRGLRASGVPRDNVWVTTKLGHWTSNTVVAQADVEESLRALGTDYVDLLLVHWPRSDTFEATIDALQDVQTAGLTRHIGVCNCPPSMLGRAVARARVVTDQVEYHPFLSQGAIRTQCLDNDMFLTAYAPLARGRVIDHPVITEIAAGHMRTTAQVALRWLVQQPRVAAIPKASSVERVRENLQIFDFALAAEEMDAIAGLDDGGRLVSPPHAPQWERG